MTDEKLITTVELEGSIVCAVLPEGVTSVVLSEPVLQDHIPLLVQKDGVQLLRIDRNGDIVVRGVVVANDPEVAQVVSECWGVR